MLGRRLLGLMGGAYSAAGPSFDTDAAAYIAAMSVQPDDTRKALIGDLIVGLKSDGVWPMIDWLCLMAAHTSQAGYLNAKQPTKTLTATGGSFTADRGWTGGGGSTRLGTGEAVSASQWALNSAHAAAYCNLEGTGNLTYVSDQGGSTTSATYNGSTKDVVINGKAATAPVGVRAGHYCMADVAAGASGVRFFVNGGANVASGPGGTPTVSTSQIFVGAYGTAGGGTITSRFAAFHQGAALTQAQNAAIVARLSTYLTAIGAQ